VDSLPQSKGSSQSLIQKKKKNDKHGPSPLTLPSNSVARGSRRGRERKREPMRRGGYAGKFLEMGDSELQAHPSRIIEKSGYQSREQRDRIISKAKESGP